MPICGVEYRVNFGPLKLLPKPGPEIPVQQYGIKTCVDLIRVARMNGEESGVFAEIIAPDTVELSKFYDEVKLTPPIICLVGEQINSHPLTRGRLRWVKGIPN